MKKLLTIALVAAFAAGSTVATLAADKADKTPSTKTEKAADRKEARPPFHGKISAVDLAARTVKVGERTFHVTPTTKIMMSGKPATLEDAKVGEDVGGQYREGEAGRLEALSLRVGPKPEKKAKNAQPK